MCTELELISGDKSFEVDLMEFSKLIVPLNACYPTPNFF